MKNETENKTPIPPTKEQVIHTVIDIFVRVIGFIEREKVSGSTNIDEDFYIDGDDLSIFAMEVEKYFGFKTPPCEDWPPGFDPTIEGIADYVLQQI
jgi:acyl carrier protein